MQITMEMLLTLLTHEYPDLVILNRGRQGDVEEIRLLPEKVDTTALLQNTLYITDHIQSELLSSIPKKTYILFFGPMEAVSKQYADITVVRSDRETAVLFNAVIRYFHEYMEWERRMDHAIYKKEDFQDLIDISEELLGLPMLIYDPSLKLLAYSKKQAGLKDRIFQNSIRTGYLSPDAVPYFQKTHFFEEMEHSEFARGLPDGFRQNEDYVKVVTVRNTLAAFCVMLNTRKYSIGFMSQVFRIFCDSVQRMLEWQNRDFRKAHSMTDYFLLDYLNNPDIPVEILRERAGLTDLDIDGKYIVATLHPKENKEPALKTLIETLRSEMISSNVFAYKDHIVILYRLIPHQRTDYQGYMERRYGSLLKQLHRKEVLFFSRPFQGIDKFPEAYAQAEGLYKIFGNSNDKSFFFYENCWMEDLFHRSQSYNLLFSYCEPMILELLEKKTERASNQLSILCAYLNQDRKCSDVADTLHMHRNNVVYHIRRLEENYHLDFGDPEIRLRFLMSFALIRHLGMWHEGSISGLF